MELKADSCLHLSATCFPTVRETCEEQLASRGVEGQMVPNGAALNYNWPGFLLSRLLRCLAVTASFLLRDTGPLATEHVIGLRQEGNVWIALPLWFSVPFVVSGSVEVSLAVGLLWKVY